MSRLSERIGLWLACALVGALVGYLYGVLRIDAVTHDPALAPWQWWWLSFGADLRRGLLCGGVVGLVLVWLVPLRRG